MKSNFEDYIDNQPLSFVFFKNRGCGGCWEVQGIMDDLKSRGIPVYYVLASENRKLGIKYSIQMVPTVIVFENGRIKGFIEGPQMMSKYESFLN